MTLPDPTAIVHTAGPVVELRQECVRCHAVLADLDGVTTDPPATDPRWWWSRGMDVAASYGSRYALNGRPSNRQIGEERCRRA